MSATNSKFSFKRVTPAAGAAPVAPATPTNPAPAASTTSTENTPAPVVKGASAFAEQAAAPVTPPAPAPAPVAPAPAPAPAPVAPAPVAAAPAAATFTQAQVDAMLAAAAAKTAPAPSAPVEVVASVPAAATKVAPAAPAPTPHTPAISGSNFAPVPAAGAQLERRAPASYGDDSDSVGVEDINLPRLNIVQKVGDLSNIFMEGDILLNKETVLIQSPKADKSGKGLRVVVCGFRADRYAEKTVGGAKGDIVDSEEAVLKKGGTTDYNEAQATGKKLYQTLAECLILLEKPEGIDDPAFSYFVEGKAYAIAIWAQKGTAYTNGTKVLRTARKAGWLKDEFNPDGSVKVKRSYSCGVWELRSELAQFGTNFAWKPSLRRCEYTTPALQAFAAQVLG